MGSEYQDILEMLSDLEESTKPRVSPVSIVPGEDADALRNTILRLIRDTVLPRRLEFTSQNGDSLILEVGSSRVTAMLAEDGSGAVVDIENDNRLTTIEKLAQHITQFCQSNVAVEFVSAKPGSEGDAEDVGITFNELQKACAAIDLMPEDNAREDITEPEHITPDSENDFLSQTQDSALGQFHLRNVDASLVSTAGSCQPEKAVAASADIYSQFLNDLSQWDSDNSNLLSQPQLIILRPSGAKGTSLAIGRDGENTHGVVHDPRKLGKIIKVWTELTQDDH